MEPDHTGEPWPDAGWPGRVLPRPAGTPVAAANALTARWAATHRDGNVVLSGVGCWLLLSALASGAAGDAREELTRAVGIPADHSAEAAADLFRLLGSIDELGAALRVWTRVVLDPEWLARLPEGLIGSLTDDPDADQRRLDRWVADATDHEVLTLPVTVTERTQLVLASVLTVTLGWAEPFIEAGTVQDGPWAGAGVPRLVRSTAALSRVRAVETATGTLTCVRLPGDGDVDVHLVRGEPHRAAPAEVLVAAIDAVVDQGTGVTGRDLPEGSPAPGVRVDHIEASDPGDRMHVTTVAFDLRATHDLRTPGNVFGLGSATDRSRGHFPGISATPLAVDEARQDVTATFSAEGFRAAAVTAVSMGAGSARPGPADGHRVRRVEVVFDRPFAFVVTHRATGLVLVAGWVDDPTPRRDPRR